jgi:hypothetical protein
MNRTHDAAKKATSKVAKTTLRIAIGISSMGENSQEGEPSQIRGKPIEAA